MANLIKIHCVKSDHIRSYSGQYFPAFGLNTGRYSVSLRIQSECGRIRTNISPNTDTFHALIVVCLILHLLKMTIKLQKFQNDHAISTTKDLVQIYNTFSKYRLPYSFMCAVAYVIAEIKPMSH